MYVYKTIKHGVITDDIVWRFVSNCKKDVLPQTHLWKIVHC